MKGWKDCYHKPKAKKGEKPVVEKHTLHEIDANEAVERFPEEWSFEPWPDAEVVDKSPRGPGPSDFASDSPNGPPVAERGPLDMGNFYARGE